MSDDPFYYDDVTSVESNESGPMIETITLNSERANNLIKNESSKAFATRIQKIRSPKIQNCNHRIKI